MPEVTNKMKEYDVVGIGLLKGSVKVVESGDERVLVLHRRDDNNVRIELSDDEYEDIKEKFQLMQYE